MKNSKDSHIECGDFFFLQHLACWSYLYKHEQTFYTCVKICNGESQFPQLPVLTTFLLQPTGTLHLPQEEVFVQHGYHIIS